MEINPIEVLHHLKALGYENVEPHLLQKFIKGIPNYTVYNLIWQKNNILGILYCIFVYGLSIALWFNDFYRASKIILWDNSINKQIIAKLFLIHAQLYRLTVNWFTLV